MDRKLEALTTARKRAKWHEDAEAIAWAQDEIERLTKMVRHAAATEGVTFPADTLPRVAGAETIVVCPVCKTEWKFDNHDSCPACGLPPQGVN
jgi:rubrerythrin